MIITCIIALSSSEASKRHGHASERLSQAENAQCRKFSAVRLQHEGLLQRDQRRHGLAFVALNRDFAMANQSARARNPVVGIKDML